MSSYPLRESMEHLKFTAEQMFNRHYLHFTIIMKSFGGGLLTQTVLTLTGDEKRAMEAELKKNLTEEIKQEGLTEVVLIGDANFATGNFPTKTDVLALTYASDRENFIWIAVLKKEERQLGPWVRLEDSLLSGVFKEAKAS